MKRVIIGLVIVVIILGIGVDYIYFHFNPEPKLLPNDSRIPNDEILFTPLSEVAEQPLQWINFIQMDKSGYQKLSYKIPGYLFSDKIPITIYWQSLGRIFTWSLDGKSVGGIFPAGQTNQQGYPVVIREDGKILYCIPQRSIIARDKIIALSDNEIMAIEMYLNSEDQRLVTFNMNTCQITKVVYSPGTNEVLKGFSVSKNRFLAVEFSSSRYWQHNIQNDDFVGIRVYDSDLKVIGEIKEAKSPSLSNDGEYLAYINGLQQVCITKVENITISCFGNALNGISWSPDNQQLVYTNERDNVILKNLETKQEAVIAYGIYPNWRPKNGIGN